VLNAAIQRAMLSDGASMANAQLLDPQRAGLQIVAHSGFTTEFLEFFALVDDTASACGSALPAGAPVWVTDTTRSPISAGTRAFEVMLEAGSRAVASMPVTSPAGRLIGMLSTHHTPPASWTDQRKQELQSLANSTGRLLDHFTPTMPEGRRDLQLHVAIRASSGFSADRGQLRAPSHADSCRIRRVFP
jgi:GAF domain-containing protein